MEQKKVNIFGLKVSTMGLEETKEWILGRSGGAKVYCCTLNELVMAQGNEIFKKMLERGTVLTADGMPLVWEIRRKTGNGERVYGPDLLKKFLILNLEFKIKQAFIGDEKNKKYFEKFGEYVVLPFKSKFEKTDYQMVSEKIKKSRAKIIWIGLGAEKQIVAADNLAEVLPENIFITVGAAFDFLSGNKRQAPRWMQKMGLEWLFRLVSEPRRLGKRYLKITVFLIKYYTTALWR